MPPLPLSTTGRRGLAGTRRPVVLPVTQAVLRQCCAPVTQKNAQSLSAGTVTPAHWLHGLLGVDLKLCIKLSDTTMDTNMEIYPGEIYRVASEKPRQAFRQYCQVKSVELSSFTTFYNDLWRINLTQVLKVSCMEKINLSFQHLHVIKTPGIKSKILVIPL